MPAWERGWGAAVAALAVAAASAVATVDRAPARAAQLDPLLVAPSHAFRWSQTALAEGRTEAAAEVALEGLARAPWYGPGWALLGRATAAWVTAEAALPYYRLAMMLDPAGRRTLAVAAPPLLRAGRLPVSAAVRLYLRREVPELAAALPATPPSGWPAMAAGDALAPAAAEQLARRGRGQWLAALEAAPGAAALAPGVRRYTLTAACAYRPEACLAALHACADGGSQACPRGVAMDRRLAEAATRAARRTGDRAAAARWAREVLRHGPDRRAVERAAEALQWAGHGDEAARLLRVHPAMQGGR